MQHYLEVLRHYVKCRKGSVVVLCTVVFVSFVFFSGIVYEASVRNAAVTTAETALQNAGRVVLSCYDQDLQKRYELFAYELNASDTEKLIEKLMKETLDEMSLCDISIKEVKVETGQYSTADASNIKAQITEMMESRVIMDTILKSVEYMNNISDSVRDKNDTEARIEDLEKEREEYEQMLQENSSQDGSDDASASEMADIKQVHSMLKRIITQSEPNTDFDGVPRSLRNKGVKDGLPSVQNDISAGTSFSILEKFTAFGEDRNKTDMKEDILINEYISSHFDNYQKSEGIPDADSFFAGEMEYILLGGESDEDNYSKTLKIIFAVRTALNTAHIYSDAEKLAATLQAAETLTPGPFAPLTQLLIISAWSSVEASNDMFNLKNGGVVPLMKNEETWMTDLNGLLAGELTENIISVSDSGGMDYGGYLKLLLMAQDSAVKISRMMDLIQINMKGRVRQEFTAADHYTGLSVSCSFEVGSRSLSVKDYGFETAMEHVYVR